MVIEVDYLYQVAPLDRDQRRRYFLSEAAAVRYAAAQADASFHTPEWLVAVTAREPNALRRTVEYVTVNRAGEVVRRHAVDELEVPA